MKHGFGHTRLTLCVMCMGIYALSEEKRAAMLSDYVAGLSIKECAEKYNVSRRVPEQLAKKNGVSRPRQGAVRDWRAETDRICSLYRSGQGVKSIAKAITGNISGVNSIIRVLCDAGLYGSKPGQIGDAWWSTYYTNEIKAFGDYEYEYDKGYIQAYPKYELIGPKAPWRLAQPDKRRILDNRAQAARRERMKNDPYWKMEQWARRQSRRVASIAKNFVKSRKSIEYMGCTPEQAAQHIASMFKDGMSWDNHGTRWHIDHIRQLSDVNLDNEQDRSAAMHYTNLRPLWTHQNLTRPHGRYAKTRKVC